MFTPYIDFSAPIFRIYRRTGSLPERMSESVPLHGSFCRHIEDSGAACEEGSDTENRLTIQATSNVATGFVGTQDQLKIMNNGGMQGARCIFAVGRLRDYLHIAFSAREGVHVAACCRCTLSVRTPHNRLERSWQTLGSLAYPVLWHLFWSDIIAPTAFYPVSNLLPKPGRQRHESLRLLP